MSKHKPRMKKKRPVSHHAAIRSVQREGFQMSEDEAMQILRAINNGFHARLDRTHPINDSERWNVVFRGKRLKVVTDRHRRTIITVLCA